MINSSSISDQFPCAVHAYQILCSCSCCPHAGPFGALLRWKLAHFNGKLPGSLHWFPAGTYAANMVACATIFAAQVRNDADCKAEMVRVHSRILCHC